MERSENYNVVNVPKIKKKLRARSARENSFPSKMLAIQGAGIVSPAIIIQKLKLNLKHLLCSISSVLV